MRIIKIVSNMWQRLMFWLFRVLPVFVIAIVGLGAQSCQVEYPSQPPPPTYGSLWTELYRGWLDEGYYIAWTFSMYESIWINVEFSGYKERRSLRLWVFVIPAEDFDRWKEGKPVRYVDWINSDGEGAEPPGPYADAVADNQMMLSSPVWGWGDYTIIVKNEWLLDFTSGDSYIIVRESHR